MNRLVEAAIKGYFKFRTFKYRHWKNHPLETQELLFRWLIVRLSCTSFGHDHHVMPGMTYKDYVKNIPVQQYEDIYPYIDRMLNHEADVLWPGKVRMFSKSSGTTNDVSKYIPVSQEALQKNNYKAGRDLYTIIVNEIPDTNIFKKHGKVLSITGRIQDVRDDIKIGDVSAIIASELPALFQGMRLPTLPITMIHNWEEKMKATLKEALEHNVTHLSGVPTWFVSMFDRIKKKHHFNTLRDVWPNLELFVHGAVAFNSYRSIFEELMPFKDMRYLEVYNASEGFFAIQDDLSKKGEMLLLTDHGVFYEFIPFDNYKEGSRETVLLSQVQMGVDYALVITTNAGLWRYDIGDVVCFTSINPYRIKIVGRTRAFINLCGEELMVGNTDQAISELSHMFGVKIAHYTVAPIFMNREGKAGHQWLIEFEGDAPKDINRFVSDLDQKLQTLNSDYAAKRTADMALQMIDLTVVPKGTFMKWLESKGKLGGQHKVPKLSPEREILEAILKKPSSTL